MDRGVPKIAYRCSSFDWEMEAVASEVALLRRHFPGSIVWGVGPRIRGVRFSRGVFAFHHRWSLLFRLLVTIGQGRFDIQHLFGGFSDWFHLRYVRDSRPVLLTVATTLPSDGLEFVDKISFFAVEWPAAADWLIGQGVASDRVRIVWPPVDTERFKPVREPPDRFTVLFASSPDRADWMEARGIGLILEAARLCPDYRFRLVWRPWNESLCALYSILQKISLPNVEVVTGRQEAMSEVYQNCHVVVAPFLDARYCKPVPNSVIEGLAVGRPAVVTAEVGICDLLAEWGAGSVAEKNRVESFVASLRVTAAQWNVMSRRARRLAESVFSVDNFVQAYRTIYNRLTS